MALADFIYRMYSDAGRNLRDIGGDIGETRRENARLGYEGRRAKLMEPVQRLQSEEAQSKLDIANSPFMIQNILPMNKDKNSLMAAITHGVIGDVAQTFGLDIDPDRGVFLRNGKVVTNRMAAPFMHHVAAVIRSKQDAGHALMSQIGELQAKKESGDWTPEEETELNRLIKMSEDPAQKLKWHEKSLDDNERSIAVFKSKGLNTSALEAGRDRDIRKINQYQGKINQAEQRAYSEKQADKAFRRQKQLLRMKLTSGIKKNKDKSYTISMGKDERGKDISANLSQQDYKQLEDYTKMLRKKYASERETEMGDLKFLDAPLSQKDAYIYANGFENAIKGIGEGTKDASAVRATLEKYGASSALLEIFDKKVKEIQDGAK